MSKKIPQTVYDIVIDFENSHGSYVHDKSRNEDFLDFLSMFSSLPLGYNHPVFDSSFEQKIISVSKIRTSNNLFSSTELTNFRSIFLGYLRHPFLHFTSTGALAVEAALKTALFQKKTSEPVFWALEKAFHGINSWGFLTDSFGPSENRINWYPKNNWENMSIDKMIDALQNNTQPDELRGILIEPILCTSGDIYISPDKLRLLSRLCLQKDICFIVDEIQTGFGPSGSMWYSDRIDLRYDILVFGKKSQIMGINVSNNYSSAFESPFRILEVTFDGDLVDALRAEYILKAYEEGDLLTKAIRREEEIISSLSPIFNNFRATGNLWAFDFDTPEERDSFCSRCFDNRLLLNKGGLSSVRMRPNLAVTDYELEEMHRIIKLSV